MHVLVPMCMCQSVGACLVECGEVQGILTNKNERGERERCSFLNILFPYGVQVVSGYGFDLSCCLVVDLPFSVSWL